MPNPDPPGRVSWVARGVGAVLCLAVGGVAAVALLHSREQAPALNEPTLLHLPPLVDQHPRGADSTASQAEARDPVEVPDEPAPSAVSTAPAPPDPPRRDPPRRDLTPRAPIERREVLPMAGSDGADAGTAEPWRRPARDVEAPADAAPPPPEAQSTLPPAVTLPLATAAPPADSTPQEQPPDVAPPGEKCGFSTCMVGFGCCNPSCGVCVAPGENCDPTPCENKIQFPHSESCGRSTCSVGEVCCNPSCGTCVSPGESCDLTACTNAIQYP